MSDLESLQNAANQTPRVALLSHDKEQKSIAEIRQQLRENRAGRNLLVACIFAGVLTGLVILSGVLWKKMPQSRTPDVNVSIAPNNAAFVIHNRDSTPLQITRFVVNGHFRPSRLPVTIAAGNSYVFPFALFIDDRGTKFNRSTHSLQNVYASGETEDGTTWSYRDRPPVQEIKSSHTGTPANQSPSHDDTLMVGY